MSVRILAADDDFTSQLLLERFCQNLGVSYYIVDNGALALKRYKMSEFDLIIMDCQMPEMDGYEATRAIRKLEEEKGNGKHIPIIGVSAYLITESEEKCLAAGMDGFIPKPLDKNHIVNMVIKFVGPGLVKLPAPKTSAVAQ